MKTTAERTRKAIAEVAGCSIEQATDDKHLANDLDLDSLDRYELTIDLEDEFGIEIPDEDADHLNTVGEIVALVESRVKP